MSERARSSDTGGRSTVAAVLLAPGAGADRNHHTLVAVEQALAPLPVARMDFPYRRAGRRAPDRAPVAVQAVRDEVAQLGRRERVDPSSIVVGGRSYGGRMCSMAVAEGMDAAGLVLLSYPLHPPGKPDRLRTDHFGDLHVPCLFVSGDRDPFGTREEFEEATVVIPGPVTHAWVPGAHDPKGQDDEIGRIVREWIAAFVSGPG